MRVLHARERGGISRAKLHLQGIGERHRRSVVISELIQKATLHFPDYTGITLPHHRLDSRNDGRFEWSARHKVGAAVRRDRGNSALKCSRSNLGVDESNEVVGDPVHPTLVAAQIDNALLRAMCAVVGPSGEVGLEVALESIAA
jgi:hypothetical protein